MLLMLKVLVWTSEIYRIFC